MADTPESGDRTEAPTPKRKQSAVEEGDVLQSRELGTALVVLGGAVWIALVGPMMMGALETMIVDALTFEASDLQNFDPSSVILRLLGIIALPLLGLFAITLVAAIGAPAALGSLGIRGKAFAFKASKLNPLSGMKRMFGAHGIIELGKSLAKVLVLGGIGV